MAQHLDRRLHAQSGLGFLDLRPPGPLAHFVELPLGDVPPAAPLVETSRQRADLLAVAPAALGEIGVQLVDERRA